MNDQPLPGYSVCELQQYFWVHQNDDAMVRAKAERARMTTEQVARARATFARVSGHEDRRARNALTAELDENALEFWLLKSLHEKIAPHLATMQVAIMESTSAAKSKAIIDTREDLDAWHAANGNA